MKRIVKTIMIGLLCLPMVILTVQPVSAGTFGDNDSLTSAESEGPVITPDDSGNPPSIDGGETDLSGGGGSGNPGGNTGGNGTGNGGDNTGNTEDNTGSGDNTGNTDNAQTPLDSGIFDEFFRIAGLYDHEWFAGSSKFSFTVPCSNFANASGKAFTRKDLEKIEITVITADGKVHRPTITDDPDYAGDYIYSFNTPAQEWGSKYTISFRNGDTIRTIDGVIKKEVELTVTVSDLTYTGKNLTPKVTIKDGSTTLNSGTDYIITSDPGMSAVKKIGLYGIYIDSPLTSKYSIHETKMFKVNPKGTKISKLTASRKGFKATWKKQTKQTTGYQIRYSLNKSMKGARKATISKAKTVSKKISRLKAKKKYYVQIRTYKTVNGQKYYSAWSKAKTIKTK